MCEAHEPEGASRPPMDTLWYLEASEVLEQRLEEMHSLARALHEEKLVNPRDVEFATSLLDQFKNTYSLSPRQWPWVSTLLERAYGAEPLYGDFKAILVMFRIAGERMQSARDRTDRNYAKPPQPKIRLLTSDDIYVQLTFNPEKPSQVDIYRDGWQGSGKRRFCGWIRDDRIIPYSTQRMTQTIKDIIQELSLDPQKVALAMAQRIGACMYCGSRLTDEPSKAVGYGPVCAENYELPWGTSSPEATKAIWKSFGLGDL